MNEIAHWSIEQSRTLYGIENWGGDYFDVNHAGNIIVKPDGPEGEEIDLYELLASVTEREIETPVLFRFNGVLRHRIHSVYTAFQNAIKEFDYQGKYFPAFPIKVNQQRPVVEAVRQADHTFPMGFEVGSKPELIAVLGLDRDPAGLILCNGYKDHSYIEFALMAKKVGHEPIIIVEKRSELPLILKAAARLKVKPDIGFRLRLSGKGAGRWERSGGDRAKFGLTIGEILECVEELQAAGLLDCLRLLHFHAGSQLTSISPLSTAIKEAGQVYAQLRKSCERLDYFDVGGGLAVDYDGSKTRFASSMNYTLAEYARDIIWVLGEICKTAEVSQPHIVTESGRASVAYHSVLVFDVLGIANTFASECQPEKILADTKQTTVRNLAHLLKDVSPKNCQETLHDAIELRTDLVQQFNLGLLSLEDRARGDRCFWAVLQAVSRHAKALHYIPEDLQRLPDVLTDTYFCNFSIFQSLPDSWAIQQIFPITPLHRLNEEPTASVVLADITCDSDGSIDRFPDLRDVKRHLPAHPLRKNETYYMAAFLVGAYQETLGDLHNLFGDTNVVHVEINDKKQIELSSVILGDSIGDVLKYVQFKKGSLCENWRNILEKAVSSGAITPVESGKMLRKYSRAFESYTYLG